MAIVTIIGAGMMGSALAFPAAENGHQVRLVGTHLDREIIETSIKTGRHPKFTRDFPAGISYHQIEEMEQAISGADMIIGGVSSFGVDWFAEHVLPAIPDDIPVLTVTKGLVDTADGKLLCYPDVWQQKLDAIGSKVSLNAIGGPCTSYELVAHDQTEVAFCGRDLTVLQKLKNIMATDYYHISLSTDVLGIESAVALKNGYALGIALTIGLNQKAFGPDSELHFNSQAAVFGQSLKEMKRLLAYQGCDTLENLAVGIGDLYVTVYGGRTRLVGILLGRGLDIDEAKAELNGVTLESLVVAGRVARAVRIAVRKGLLQAEDFPLLMHIDDIITNKAIVNIPWEAFTFNGDTPQQAPAATMPSMSELALVVTEAVDAALANHGISKLKSENTQQTMDRTPAAQTLAPVMNTKKKAQSKPTEAPVQALIDLDIPDDIMDKALAFSDMFG